MSFHDGFMFELGRATMSLLIALCIIVALFAIGGVVALSVWGVQRWRMRRKREV